MCGRIVITLPVEAMARLFDFPERPNWRARYNIGPMQELPVVTSISGQVHMQTAIWGFTHLGRSAPLINARSESVLSKPTWANAVRERPCVFFANGYFEWDARTDRKQPYFIRPCSGEIALIAGCWRYQEGQMHAVPLTRSPRPEIEPLHHRMPHLLTRDQAMVWMDVDAPGRLELLKTLYPHCLDFFPVNPRVGRIGHDDVSNIERFEPQENAQLSLL